MSFSNSSFVNTSNGTKSKHLDLRCFEREKRMHTKGIFYGENPLNSAYSVFMFQMILIFLVSRAVYIVLRPLRQPKFVCNILAGIILGPSVLGRNQTYMKVFFPDNEMMIFDTFVTLGTTFFVFITAVKVDTGMLVNIARSSAWTFGLLGYTVTFISNFIVIAALRKSLLAVPSLVAVFGVVVGLAVNYFSVTVRIMEDYNLLASELGQLAMSSSMLSETIGWCSLCLIVVMKQQNSAAAFNAGLAMFIVVLFAVYVIRPILNHIIKKTPVGKPVSEPYVIAILIGAMIMALMSNLVTGLMLPGALLMGLIIPGGPPLASTIVEKSELMVMEFFVPFIYIQIGYYTDVYSIKDMNLLTIELLVIVVGYLAKMLGTLVASLHFDIRIENAILLGLIMNFKVLDGINYRRWLLLRLVGKQTYATFVLTNVLVNAIMSPLVEKFYKPQYRLNGLHLDKQRKRSLQSAWITEELKVISCIHYEYNVHSIITIIEAMNPNRRCSICVHAIHLNELIGRSDPALVPYTSKRSRYDPHNSDHIVQAFTNYSDNSCGSISVQPFVLTAPYGIMDTLVTNFAVDKKVSLIIVPFLENQEIDQNKQTMSHKFNAKLQEFAPCTVGILLDRGLSSGKSTYNFSCHVAVIFMGGPDDREALTLAIRMCGHPGVSVELINIQAISEIDDTNKTEKELDDLLVKEFKKRKNNSTIAFREAMVNDGIDMMEVLRSIDSHYDLIMVGKGPSHMIKYKEEMEEWIEHEELGIVGDFLASKDFCGGTMSLLVLKRYVESM